MKRLLIILGCALTALIVAPTAHAGYRRTIVGYDSKARPIIRVVWVADHLDFPRTVSQRRSYPTSGRRDIAELYAPGSTVSIDRPSSRYSASDHEKPIYVYEE